MKDFHAPVLSIVIPNYNYGEFLCLLLDSINKSKYREIIEVIVVDGGSTDGSIDNARKWLMPDDTLISEKDKGQSHAISKGLKIAKGRWFIFQNSDDLFETTGLDSAIETMKMNIKSNIIVGSYGLCLKYKNNWEKMLDYIPVYGIRGFMLNLNLYFPNQCTFYLTKYAKQIDFDIEKKFALDLDFTVRYIKFHGLSYRIVPAVIGYLRLHNDSKTSNMQSICSTEVTEIRRNNFGFMDRIKCFFYYPGYILYSYFAKKRYREMLLGKRKL